MFYRGKPCVPLKHFIPISKLWAMPHTEKCSAVLLKEEVNNIEDVALSVDQGFGGVSCSRYFISEQAPAPEDIVLY